MRSDHVTLNLTRHNDHILIVMLDRPDAANAMNTQMGRELMEVFETFQIELHGLRCVILTGRGEKAFCAGGDLKERRGMSDEAWQAQHAVFERMVRAIVSCPLPRKRRASLSPRSRLASCLGPEELRPCRAPWASGAPWKSFLPACRSRPRKR